MRAAAIFLLGGLFGAGAVVFPKAVSHLRAALRKAPLQPPGSLVHTDESFQFLAHGTLDEIAPLFGADKERVWAPGWNPQFVYPLPAPDDKEPKDKEGMVFAVDHGHHRAIWLNTEFDLVNGRVTYAYVIPDAMVTLIRLRLTPAGQTTRVNVIYQRTSLSPQADEHVRRLAEGDRRSGPEWQT